MNIEFHYYITAWLANRAGFSSLDASVIGASSQYVDQRLVAYDIEVPRLTVRFDPTQDYSFWDEEVRDSIYLPFHFIPSFDDSGTNPRLDGKRNPWSVAKDSECARELLIEALKSKNLFRIGIAVHAYADTWAHQNFSGLNEKWNLIDDRFPIPPVGHAHALKQPDSLSAVWSDPRLESGFSLVNNRERFMGAAKKIFKYFRTFLKRGFDDADFVIETLSTLLGKPGERHRDERTLNLVIDASFPAYDRNAWFREAGIRDTGMENKHIVDGYDRLLWLKNGISQSLGFGKTHTIQAGKEFFGSSLEQWNEAAVQHRKTALALFEKNRRHP